MDWISHLVLLLLVFVLGYIAYEFNKRINFLEKKLIVKDTSIALNVVDSLIVTSSEKVDSIQEPLLEVKQEFNQLPKQVSKQLFKDTAGKGDLKNFICTEDSESFMTER